MSIKIKNLIGKGKKNEYEYGRFSRNKNVEEKGK